MVAVYTADDVAKAGLPGMIPVGWLLPNLKIPPHPMLAKDTVRYVGDAVAVVVAEDRYVARDAADLVEVDYEPLPRGHRRRAARSRPARRRSTTRRRRTSRSTGRSATAQRTDDAFAKAAHTASIELRNNRLIPHAIEPRSALANFNPTTGKLTLHLTTQNPHVHRLLMTLASLGLPEHKMRVIAPEVGGGFGSQDLSLRRTRRSSSFCSMQLSRPVKWTATRSETNLTDAHGRDHVTQAPRSRSTPTTGSSGCAVDTYAAPRRLPLDLRARDPDLSLRHAALRRSTTSRRSTAR